MPKRKIIDDGYYPWLVRTATYDSLLEMPIIKAPRRLVIPSKLIPYSKINCSDDKKECIHLYEPDVDLQGILSDPEQAIQKIYPFKGLITPECVGYKQLEPLPQMLQTYLSRAFGHYFQEQGVEVIPAIQWGDESSYTPTIADIPYAFLGVEKNSIVSINAQGSLGSTENRRSFYGGLQAMVKYIQPEVIIIYGSLPLHQLPEIPANIQCIYFNDTGTRSNRQVA